MKVVYVSGPYRAPTVYGIVQNIRRAEQIAIALWQKGFAVICPHTNTALMDGSISIKDSETFIKGDLEIVKRCDAVFLMKNWENSVGAVLERQFAIDHNIPVFHNFGDIWQWKSLYDKEEMNGTGNSDNG